MNHIGELYGIPDEKHGEIISDQVVVAILGIELYGKAPGSRTVSAEPRPPVTVENRTNTGVFFAGS